MLLLGKTFPDFSANTTEGEINFHEWLGDKYVIFKKVNEFINIKICMYLYVFFFLSNKNHKSYT